MSNGTREKIDLPDWPRLMRAELAAKYLSIGVTTLKSLNLRTIVLGNRTLWDRKALDEFVDGPTSPTYDWRKDQPGLNADR